MDEARFAEGARWVPRLVVVAEVALVAVQGAELAAQETVSAVRQDHGGVGVQGVEDLHVEVVVLAGRGVRGGGEPAGFDRGRLQQDEHGGELLLVGEHPVRAHHRDGGGRQQEEVVHVAEDGGVRVEVDNAEVLRLVEGQELGEAGVPRCVLPVRLLLRLSWPRVASEFAHLDRHELDVVGVHGFDEELAVPVRLVGNIGVPFFGVHENALGATAESVQRLEDHEGVA